MQEQQKNDGKRIIFSFFGPPGSGKGTLAERAARELKFEVLSTGNLCRKHIAQKTELGEKLDFYVKKGQLIPDELITLMVKEWLESVIHAQVPIILDGYPRTKGQASHFLEMLPMIAPGFFYRVILVELPDDEIVKRLTNRRVCGNKSCQTVYQPSYQSNLCAVCGTALAKRDDDKEEIIRERLKLYPAYRDLLLDFYRKNGNSIEVFSVVDLTPEQVFNTFRAMV